MDDVAFRYEGQPDIPAGATIREWRIGRSRAKRAEKQAAKDAARLSRLGRACEVCGRMLAERPTATLFALSAFHIAHTALGLPVEGVEQAVLASATAPGAKS